MVAASEINLAAIPSDLIKEWNEFLKNFEQLRFEVNRNVFVNYENDPVVKRELHGFRDASLPAC